MTTGRNPSSLNNSSISVNKRRESPPQKNLPMRNPLLKCLIFPIAGLLVSIPLKSQISISAFIDAGENNVSRGPYVKTSILGDIQFSGSTLEAGSVANIRYSGHKIISGASLSFGHQFYIKKFSLEVAGFYLANPFSDLIHESDWGILLKSGQKHFQYMAGFAFRTYKITREAMNKYDIEANTSLHENWNLVYQLGYSVKPANNKWNIGLSVTNFDHFLINQETNPMIYISGHYKISPELTLFSEAWYKNAGAFNLYANYFGFFIRTGMIWKLNLKK